MDTYDPSTGAGAESRTPPQDLVAEQSVLGGMMLSKDAIADCVEVLRGVDFYRPSHESVYEAIIDLYGRGEPADAVTVADELTKRGDLNRIGGAVEITTGRRLAAEQVSTADSQVVMLDAQDAYQQVADRELQIYWGAYLGTADEILIAGKLKDVADQIERVRKAARHANGWIMDTYLIRKPD